jgi:hypothetical protein
MRVLFATTPDHQGALTPFAHACRRAGHQVLVAGPEPLADDLRFWPVADLGAAIGDWAPDLVVGERAGVADVVVDPGLRTSGSGLTLVPESLDGPSAGVVRFRDPVAAWAPPVWGEWERPQQPAAYVALDADASLSVARTAVLRNASVAVCHGETSRILSALAAGIPLVLSPRTGSEGFNARRITELKLGVVADGDLDGAIRRVLSFEIYTDRARRVRDEIHALPSVDEAVDVLIALAGARAAAA